MARRRKKRSKKILKSKGFDESYYDRLKDPEPYVLGDYMSNEEIKNPEDRKRYEN